MSNRAFDFAEVFDADYLYFYEPRLEQVSYADAEVIWRRLGLERGTQVLDLACGHGRIANRLAERGARVTVLDATPLFLERAREDAAARGLEVQYVEGDMRSLRWADGSFDCVTAGSRPSDTSRTTTTAACSWRRCACCGRVAAS